MTGAQEKALDRLKRAHRDLSYRVGRSYVRVDYTKRSSWGGERTVKANITPEGRIVEVP